MSSNLRCDCDVIHHDVVIQVSQNRLQTTIVDDLAKLFKLFGDPTRLKILWALKTHEMCVCDISVVLDMTQSAISHQLKVLKEAHLIDSRRDGKVIFYQLKDQHVNTIFDLTLEHLLESVQP